jgi:hypothetical protein
MKRTKCNDEKKHVDANQYTIHGFLKWELAEYLEKNTPGNVQADSKLFGALRLCILSSIGRTVYMIDHERSKCRHDHRRRCVTLHITSIDRVDDREKMQMGVDELVAIIKRNPNFQIVRVKNTYYSGNYAKMWVGCPIEVPDLMTLCVDVASKHLDAATSYCQLPADLQDKYFQLVNDGGEHYRWNVK